MDNIIILQIDAKQFGGMDGTGTTGALVEMLHKWCEATDEPGTTVRVCSWINHETLIDKLVAMNLPAHIVRWMDFLLDSEQTVKIGESVSQPGYPNGGVPQGTLSEPKNVLVYINDIRTPCSIYEYVDDSTVFEICNPTSVSVLQQPAASIANWSIDNGMRINTMKTKAIIIRFCRDPVFLPYSNIDGAAIERVSQVKVLGVTLSSDLSWNAHVDGIVSKARKRVFLVYQLKRADIGKCDLVRIYIQVIRPVVEYACPAWHTHLPKYFSDNIELIQKRCMKTIFPGCSYDDILEMTNLPTLHDRRTSLCITYFNKMSRSNHKLNALLPGRRTVPYALRPSNGLPVPSAKTNRYKNSFIPWGLSNCQDC